MTSEQKSAIVIGIIVLIFLVAVCIISYIKDKRLKFVKENSILLKNIKELNNRTIYKTIYDGSYQYNCKRKQEFDNKKFDDIALLFVQNNKPQLLEQIEFVKFNKQAEFTYNQILYKVTLDAREKQQEIYSKFSYFYELEKELADGILINMKTELYLKITKLYISPQGRNRYKNDKTYNTTQIEALIEKDNQTEKTKSSIKHERAIMTDSLRYDILKRDGFRCKICGATQDDGVKLHVDHIKPVSRGGKTEPSNLRTLCDRCNLGKSDKYDKNGIN